LTLKVKECQMLEVDLDKDKKEISKKIKDRFSSSEVINRKELYDFLEKNFFPGLKEATFRWRIYELKKDNVITPVKRGVYQLSNDKNIYKPNVNQAIQKISRILLKKYSDLSYCIWNSNWLNEFSRHQVVNEVIFVEVEKELVRSIFNLLLDGSCRNVYIEPDKFMTQTYISENQTSIIVNSMISKSPIQAVRDVKVPRLEKMLVDLFSDDKYLVAYKGHEQVVIFENALNEYQINLSNLINYSRRRKKDKLITDFLIKDLNLDKELMK